MFAFFFFQAEDGIRDLTVTGVQTCALPILSSTSLTVGHGVASRSAAKPVCGRAVAIRCSAPMLRIVLPTGIPTASSNAITAGLLRWAVSIPDIVAVAANVRVAVEVVVVVDVDVVVAP